MLVHIDTSGSLEGLEKILSDFASDDMVKSVMILACEGNGFQPSNCDSILTGSSKPVFGGIFPQLLTESGMLSKGTIVVGMRSEVSVLTLKNISNPEADFVKMFKSQPGITPNSHKTIFLFVDGMSGTIAPLLDETFNQLGLGSNYIGGGAGSSTFRPMPCIITEEGILSDAALFAFADLDSGVGVAHGWYPVSRTFKVTEAEYNTVVSFDWKPALQVYKEIIAEKTGHPVEEVQLKELASHFPLGVLKMADELLVRDPVKFKGNSLICLGNLPVNSFVNVLGGDPDSLLEGTRKSRKIAEEVFRRNFGETRPGEQLTFFIDCITREQFLGDKYPEEIKIASGGQKMIGALSLGEIANSGADYLELYNKTAVVGIVQY